MTKTLLILLLLACLLRLPLLNGSFWLDEAAEALAGQQPLAQLLLMRGDFHPPLHYVPVHFFLLVSRAEWWLRLTSLLPALMTLFLTVKLSQTLLKPALAGAVGLYLATSQFHLYYSQELRPYSLAAMWGILSLFYLWLWLKSRLSIWPLVLINLAGLFTVYTFVFCLIGQIVYVFMVNRDRLKAYYGHLLAVGLGSSWWWLFWLPQWQAGFKLRQLLPGWDQVVSPPWLKALPLTLEKLFLGTLPVPDALFGFGLVAGLTIGLFLAVLTTWFQPRLRPLLAYFLTVLLTAFIVTPFVPLLDPKRLLFLLPVLAILLIGALSQWSRFKFFFGGLLLLNCLVIGLYWLKPEYQREPWRALVADLEAQASDSTPVIFAFPTPFAPWVWYQTRSLPTVTTGFLVTNDLTDLDSQLEPLLKVPAVYALDYLMDLTDPQQLIYTWLDQAGFHQGSARSYSQLGQVRLFVKNESFARDMP